MNYSVRFFFIAAAMFSFATCANGPQRIDAARGSEPSPARPPAQEARPGNELSSPAFTALPAGLKPFLIALAERAALSDGAYLLAAAEPNYERRVRPLVDNDAYFALLFRLGAYSSESPAGGEALPRVDPATVRSIRYTGWNDRGPVIEIRAMLRLSDGRVMPSSLLVLWKTLPPRIVGREP